jgi:hypothetical protein
MLAVPLGSVLMDRDLWLPMYIGLSVLIFGCFVGLFIPETLKQDLELPESTTDVSDSERDPETSKSETALGQIIEAGKNTIEGFKAIFTSTLITCLVFTFLVNSLGKNSTDLYLLYASQRYHWKLSRVIIFSELGIYARLTELS